MRLRWSRRRLGIRTFFPRGVGPARKTLVRKARGDYHGDGPLPRQGDGGIQGRGSMIIVTGAVRFGNGEIERLRSALTANVEGSRKEDGCEAYSYAIDLTEPNLLRI